MHLLIVAAKRVLIGLGALTLVSFSHIRPQLSSAQFQEIQRQQQEAIQNEWTTSHWDLGQNIRLDQTDRHFESTDTRVENLRVAHESLAREVSEAHGEATVYFGILSAAVIAVMGFAFSNFLKIRDAGRKA